MEWLTIKINHPKLDCKIVARGENFLGWGYKVDIFELDSKIYTEQEAADHLGSHEYTRWMELTE